VLFEAPDCIKAAEVSRFAVEEFKALVVIFRIIHEPVIAENDPFAAAAPFFGVIVYIAFRITASFFLRTQSLIVSETIAADALSGTHFRKVSLLGVPAGISCFILSDVIGRKVTVSMDIQRHTVLVRILAILCDLF
jgi:hypothetical protein